MVSECGNFTNASDVLAIFGECTDLLEPRVDYRVYRWAMLVRSRLLEMGEGVIC